MNQGYKQTSMHNNSEQIDGIGSARLIWRMTDWICSRAGLVVQAQAQQRTKNKTPGAQSREQPKPQRQTRGRRLLWRWAALRCAALKQD